MNKLNVANQKEIQKLLFQVIKTFNLKLSKDLDIEYIKHMDKGFIIEKNDQTIKVYYSKRHQIFHSFSYILMNQDQDQYTYQMKPKMDHIGVMIDAARNAVPTIKTLESYIMMLSMFGYNYLEIYVEDVMEIDFEPLVGYMRGRYSKKDMRALDMFALDYGIEIIPCVQTLAHLERIFEHDKYNQIRDIEDILLVEEEKTYEFLDHMIQTCRNTFKSDKINIGMDEAFRLGLGAYLAKHGYQSKTEIMLKHLEHIEKLIKKQGYHAMMWADMFFQMSGGNYHLDDIEITNEIIEKVPKDITLIFWEYYETTYEAYDKKFKQIKRMTNDYAFAGGAWKWIGFTPLNRFSIKALEQSIKASLDHHVNDFLLTAWGDDGAEASIFSILPTLVYISASLYDIKDRKLYMDGLMKLLTNYTFDEFMTIDSLNELYDKIEMKNPSKYLLFDDLLMSRLDYQILPEFSLIYANKAIEIKKLSERNSNFNYMFKTQHKLSEVLSLKSKLSLEIFDAYHKDNDDTLKSSVKSLSDLIDLTQNFYDTFKYQWQQEHKGFGFEVQNYRIGGLIQQLKYIKEILQSYLDHDIDHIEQLDERISSKQKEKTIAYNSFIKTVTYGKM